MEMNAETIEMTPFGQRPKTEQWRPLRLISKAAELIRNSNRNEADNALQLIRSIMAQHGMEVTDIPNWVTREPVWKQYDLKKRLLHGAPESIDMPLGRSGQGRIVSEEDGRSCRNKAIGDRPLIEQVREAHQISSRAKVLMLEVLKPAKGKPVTMEFMRSYKREGFPKPQDPSALRMDLLFYNQMVKYVEEAERNPDFLPELFSTARATEINKNCITERAFYAAKDFIERHKLRGKQTLDFDQEGNVYRPAARRLARLPE